MPIIYSFPFTKVPLESGTAFRPILTCRLSGPSVTVPAEMLLDSGADSSIVGRALAETLGLALTRTHGGRGVSGRVPVRRSRIVVEIRHGTEWLSPISVPVEVPVRGAPPLAILGREGVFEVFDILFQLGVVPDRGMFHLVPHESPRRRLPGHRAGIRRRHRTVAG